MDLLTHCIHSRLVLNTNMDGTINMSDLNVLLSRTYHIPKELRPKIIQQLKDCKVILASSKGGFTKKGYYIINRTIKPVSA